MKQNTKKNPSARIVQVGSGATKKITPILVIAAVLAGCAGCTGTLARGKALTLQEQGFPPGFVAGYEDGCQAGYMQAGNGWATFKKDVGRYSTDAHYQQGWNNGRNTCFESSSRNRASIR